MASFFLAAFSHALGSWGLRTPSPSSRPITAADQAQPEALELPDLKAVWPAAEFAQALDRMVAAADRCLAEMTARPPWW